MEGVFVKQFQIESWVPADAWEAFDEMRRKVANRFPWTDRAKVLIQTDLWNLLQAGEDLKQVLEQSVKLGWRGVFPVRPSVIDEFRRDIRVGQGPVCNYDAPLKPEVLERIRKREEAQRVKAKT